VKADGYGHGAVPVARTALAAGAECVAVALVEKAADLRAAGIGGPIMLLSEPDLPAADAVVTLGVEPAVYTAEGLASLETAARGAGATPLTVHLKIDTGMHRVGARPDEAVALAAAIDRSPHLELGSVWTHLAVADAPDDPFTATQLHRFSEACEAVEAAGPTIPRRHAANSAGAIAHPEARLDLVRCGIAIYGLPPSPALAAAVDLRPALRLVSAVSHVQEVAGGEGISYGQRFRTIGPTTVATVPVGYADGVPRVLGAAGGHVLVGGHRRPIAGTVTMDQITVALDDGDDVRRGDEVVLLGAQGDAVIEAEEWADLAGTIGYEIATGLETGSRRAMRIVLDG